MQLRGHADLHTRKGLLSWCCGSTEWEALNSAPEEKGKLLKEGDTNLH